MPAPPTRKTLGTLLGRSVGVAATGIATAVERGGRLPVVQARAVSRDGNTVVIPSVLIPGTVEPEDGTPVAIPSGAWLGTISATGDWDDIYVGYTGLLAGGPVGAWMAHRPNTSGNAAGSLAVGSITGPRTATPVAMVDGAGGSDVTIILTLTRPSDGGS